MLETEIEVDCCNRVESLGGLALKIVSPGRRGRPDRLMILPGPVIFFVEFKRKTGRESALQASNRKRLQALGVRSYVCYSHQEFREILKQEGIAA